MSDETKKENPTPAAESRKQAPELSSDELKQTVGGLNFGDIKGEVTDDKHKGWIEILS